MQLHIPMISAYSKHAYPLLCCHVGSFSFPRHDAADAYTCRMDATATVNCLSLHQGAFPLGYAMESAFVALSIALLVQHYVIAIMGIIATFAAAYAYLFALRTEPAAGSAIADSATADAIRIGMLLGAFMLLCLTVAVTSQRINRASFTAAWSLRLQFQQQQVAIERERALRDELQASRETTLISQTARGIQELVAGESDIV